MTNRCALGIASIASVAALISLSLLIGAFYDQEQMIWLGLALVVGSSLATIFVAYRNLASARRTAGVTLEDYIPAPEPIGASFASTYGIMGVHTDPLIEVRNNVASLRKELLALRQECDRRNAFNDRRVETIHRIHKYHHEVSLPRTMATGMEWIILSAILTVWGSVYLAIPRELHVLFHDIAGSIQYVFEWLAQSI